MKPEPLAVRRHEEWVNRSSDMDESPLKLLCRLRRDKDEQLAVSDTWVLDRADAIEIFLLIGNLVVERAKLRQQIEDATIGKSPETAGVQDSPEPDA